MAKQALEEIVILPSLRPEVQFSIHTFGALFALYG